MVNQINKAIEARRFSFAQSIAQTIAQNLPTCAQPPSFHPHSNSLSYCKHTPRKVWFGLWNRGSRVQIPSLTPTPSITYAAFAVFRFLVTLVNVATFRAKNRR